jgi:thioredoxin 1
MKKTLLRTIYILAVLMSSCTMGQKKNTEFNLVPEKFLEAMNQYSSAPVLDVRTPEEYKAGFLEKAINVDWNGSDFNKGIAGLDKSKPVFVYCLSGGRSGEAASSMRKDGFLKVYELDGGILKWRSAGLPESKNTKKSGPKGMQKAEFEKLIDSDKTVLVDFYADWCGPCKKMKPDLDQLAKDEKDRLVVVRIDADANPDLAKQLSVDGLPTILIYKNKKQLKKAKGFQSKKELVNLAGL